MNKITLLKKTFYYVFFTFISVLFVTCNDTSVNAPQDFISGTVTYTDTNLSYYYGYFAVCIFGDSANPFTHHPVSRDSVQVSKVNGVAAAYYNVKGLQAGNYYIASTYITQSGGYILGTLGCNLDANCNSTRVAFPNYAGTAQLNFQSYTSLDHRLFPNPFPYP